MEFAVNERLVKIHELKKFSWEELRLNLGHSNITDTMTYVHIQTSDLVERMQEFETDVFK